MTKPPFLAWPGWSHLRFAWGLSALNGGWFALVYGGCDWITAHRAFRVRVDLPGENSLPLVPGMVVFYMSIYLLFLIGPFVVRERREFAALIAALALATGGGGTVFLLLPSELHYPPTPEQLGIWTGLFHLADRLNLDYNLAPSLHVALSVCCVDAFCRQASPLGRWLLWAWASAIALSTLFTHQHYLVDAVSGWTLGLAAHRLTTLRLHRSRDLAPVLRTGRSAGLLVFSSGCARSPRES